MLTKEELLDDKYFEYIRMLIPKDTIHFKLQCKVVFNDGEPVMMEGEFKASDIRNIRNDYVELIQYNHLQEEEGLFDSFPAHPVVLKIPKNTFHICLSLSLYIQEDIVFHKKNYDMEDIRKMRNDYLLLDPDEDFFAFCILNEDFPNTME